MELENDNGIEVILLHQDDNDPIEVVAMHGDEGGIMVGACEVAVRGGNRSGQARPDFKRPKLSLR